MKKILLLLVLFISTVGIFISCKKETPYQISTGTNPNSNPNQPNRPPIANAGVDQTITLPINNVNLDGSASIDPENNITNYEWKKFRDHLLFPNVIKIYLEVAIFMANLCGVWIALSYFAANKFDIYNFQTRNMVNRCIATGAHSAISFDISNCVGG